MAAVRVCENHGLELLETVDGNLRCPYGRGHVTMNWVVADASGRPVGKASAATEALEEPQTRVDLALVKVAQARKADIIDALTKCAGNVTVAANLLGVSRQSVYGWCQGLGLDIAPFRVGRRAPPEPRPGGRGPKRGPSVAQRLSSIEAKLDLLIGGRP